MADHIYKMKEIPKGQKGKQFVDYYLGPTLATIAGVLILASIIKSTVFAPKIDANILAVTSEYKTAMVWEVLEKETEKIGFDFNEDDKCDVKIVPIVYNEEDHDNDAEGYAAEQTKLLGELSNDKTILMICDDKSFGLFKELGILGTYADAEGILASENSEELVKIPLKETGLFKENPYISEGLYLTIRSKEAAKVETDEKAAEYKNQLGIWEKILSNP